MYSEGEEIWLRLTGGGPYGLRLGGGGTRKEPLVVAKLHKKSKARSAGVRVGDVVLSINGNSCDVMTLQTASDMIDFSRDLSIQLLRSPTVQVLVDDASSAATFRQHQQPTASRSLTVSPFLSDTEYPSSSSPSSVHIYPSQSTELFRHQVSLHQRQTSPLTSSSDRKQNERLDGETEDRKPVQQSWREVDESKTRPDEVENRVGGEGRRWQPGQSDMKTLRKLERPQVKWAPKVSDVPESQLENSECNGEANGSIPGQVEKFTPSSLLPKPSFSTRTKPDRWQPPGATHLFRETITEPESLRPNSTQPADDLIHEVVIWSSKPTEVEKQQDGDFQSHQKPLPWQPKVDQDRVDEKKELQTPARWQPSSHGNQATWQPPQPTPTDSRMTETTEQLFRWRPQSHSQSNQPSSWQPTVVKETENKQPSLWHPDNDRTSGQHAWQPTQPPVEAVDGTDGTYSHSLKNRLEEPRQQAPQDGSTSPTVTSLFLRRVVTDGSALMAGSGSDVETSHDASHTGKKKLYADSSFYEDPEHKYPTIEEQIKMARKVALLLTSPANKNARGQKMFLKRKELSSKWIIDPHNLILPPLIITPPAPEPDSSTLSPVEVEKLLLYGDKSLHDVVPFDVCSMLAAELREEKGRGGRMFARRRHQVDQTTAPETIGLVRVPDQPSFHHEPTGKYKPQPTRDPVTETIARIPPPAIQQPRDQLDSPSQSQLPVNRLKNMIDPPRAKITPWDSAIEYGTVEPAFEHLHGYRPFRGTRSYEVETVDRRSRSMPSQTRRSELKVQGHGFDQTDSFYRTSTFGSSQQESYSQPPASGFVHGADSSSFIRQGAAETNRGGYRPVRFQAGTRSFK